MDTILYILEAETIVSSEDHKIRHSFTAFTLEGFGWTLPR